MWTVFLALILALVVAGVFQAIAVVVLISWQVAHGIEADDAANQLPAMLGTPAMFILMASCGQLAFGLSALVPAWLSPTPMRERLGLCSQQQSSSVYPLTMLGSLVPLALGIGFAYLCASFLPGDPNVPLLYENMTLTSAVPFVLFIAIVPAIVEELLFRGYVQRRLLERWRPAWAIGVTALIFALMHVAPLAVVSLFPLGLWLGVVAWRSNSVYAAMLCHAFINGSVNIWRLFVKFADISDTVQTVVVLTTLLLSVVCFVAALRCLFDKRLPAPTSFAEATA